MVFILFYIGVLIALGLGLYTCDLFQLGFRRFSVEADRKAAFTANRHVVRPGPVPKSEDPTWIAFVRQQRQSLDEIALHTQKEVQCN